MARILIGFFCLAATVWARPNVETVKSDIFILVVSNVPEYMNENLEVSSTPWQNINKNTTVTVGERVNANFLLSSTGRSYNYQPAENVTLTLHYEKEGANISFVQVDIGQIAKGGHLDVDTTYGGSYATVIIEAYATSFLRYNAEFYGY